MSNNDLPRRKPAPGPHHTSPPPCFGGYPYLVSRIGRSALRHIVLVPADWPRDRIIATTRAMAEANRFETVACFGPTDALYVDSDNARTWEGPTPSGTLVIERLRLPEPIQATEELTARRAAFRAFDDANQGGRYIVGDGIDRGEPAQPEDRARLAGRGPDGLPVGLVRCPRCGHAAGDYLRKGVEIVKVRCACDNHNRCARCLRPLAAHRLSAWLWSDEDDAAWHVAAYSAFSHRCPDEGVSA